MASDICPRCGFRASKSAAMLYEGPEWKYYYCYECRRWSKRHFRYRYVVVSVDDLRTIDTLMRKMETDGEMLKSEGDEVSWIRRKLNSASRFFQRYAP